VQVVSEKKKLSQQEILCGLALRTIPFVGSITAKHLISYCGSTEAIFKTPKAKLMSIPQIAERAIDQIVKFKNWEPAERELEICNQKGIQILFYWEQDFPYRLKDCPDSPLAVFLKGDIDFNTQRVVSIVGTRNSTFYGKEFCEKLIEALAPTGCLVVSGLAFGTDANAHKSALKHGLKTVGVLGHGLSTIAPQSHRYLAQEMLENGGGLLSEHYYDDQPQPENFPKRNRIVAGLSDALIIIESAKRGGALITAELAWGYNREILALPGRVNDTYSQGCNYLIESNKAVCITTPERVVEYLGWENKELNQTKAREIKINLSEQEQKVFNLFRNGEKELDALHHESGISLSTLSLILLDLEFKGILITLPGKKYRIKM
jgi:DNA processing protein